MEHEMACTAIITDGNAIDQIVEHEGDYATIIKREVSDLREMGCTVKTKVFDNEELAYSWEDKRKGY